MVAFNLKIRWWESLEMVLRQWQTTALVSDKIMVKRRGYDVIIGVTIYLNWGSVIGYYSCYCNSRSGLSAELNGRKALRYLGIEINDFFFFCHHCESSLYGHQLGMQFLGLKIKALFIFVVETWESSLWSHWSGQQFLACFISGIIMHHILCYCLVILNFFV